VDSFAGRGGVILSSLGGGGTECRRRTELIPPPILQFGRGFIPPIHNVKFTIIYFNAIIQLYNKSKYEKLNYFIYPR